MTTIAEMYHKYVNRKAMLRVLNYPEIYHNDGTLKRRATLGIEVAVKIRDARTAYGNAHVLVEPVAGDGSAWVQVNEDLRIVDEFPHEEASAQNDPLRTGDGSG